MAVWNVVSSYWFCLVPDFLVKPVVLFLDLLLVFALHALDIDNRWRLCLRIQHCSKAAPSIFPAFVLFGSELQVVLVTRVWDALHRGLADLPQRLQRPGGRRLEVECEENELRQQPVSQIPLR